jgi:phycocyanobilin:ferredoxin oxidoreductase
VEIFNQDRFMVVHCCVFPHVTDPAPIFGFDVIAGESKITGLFWDLSPTVLPSQPFTALPIERPRQRPEWGDIFGENWIACRPTGDEMIAIADDAKSVLAEYLGNLTPNTHLPTDIIAAQNKYCIQQRKNEHTVKAIKNLLGDEIAMEFMTTVLFPIVQI